MKNKKFWNMTKNEADQTGSVELYGEISTSSWWGDEVTPKTFAEDLKALGDVKELEIHVNSGGGDVFAGMSIYNILKRHEAHKTAYIDGLAASIASVIVMAADDIVMPANATLMIHQAWTYAGGNRDELLKLAAELERIDGQISGIYADRTGKDAEAMLDLMKAETWMTAQEAADNGFPVTIEANVQAAASVLTEDFCARYDHVPERYRKTAGASPRPTGEPEQNCDKAGASPRPTGEPDNSVNEALAEQRRRFNILRAKLLNI